MPYISESDKNDILFGVELGFDIIAASFVRNKEDVLEVRKILDERNSKMMIISKIENMQGIKNLDEIIEVSDGIMVARGDMGVEVPLEEVPVLQKQIIKKAVAKGKQVITATQMLESMMHNPRPTRAETTDIANAIYDGTTAITVSYTHLDVYKRQIHGCSREVFMKIWLMEVLAGWSRKWKWRESGRRLKRQE